MYAIQSSFRVFPFVFFTRSVIEPAPQNSITSCKTNTSMQAPLHTAPSRLGRQNNQAAAPIWETLPKHKVYHLFYLSAWEVAPKQMSPMRVRRIWNMSHISYHIFKDWFNHCNLILGIWICSAMQNALAATGVRAHPMLKESSWPHHCNTSYSIIPTYLLDTRTCTGVCTLPFQTQTSVLCGV